MTVQTISELKGWRTATDLERRYIGTVLGEYYKEDSKSRIAGGICCLAAAAFILGGLGVLTFHGRADMGRLIVFGIIALLAALGGVSLLCRAREIRKTDMASGGPPYQVLKALCIQTDHRVDGNSISMIRVADREGNTCDQWLQAPRSLARSFDARRQKDPVCVFPVLIAAWGDRYWVMAVPDV